MSWKINIPILMEKGYEEEEEYEFMEGSPQQSMKLYQSNPFQIVTENTYQKAQTAVIFGNDKFLLKPRFGNPTVINITIGQPSVEYVELLHPYLSFQGR